MAEAMWLSLRMRTAVTIDTGLGDKTEIKLPPEMAGMIYLFKTREDAEADAGEDHQVLKLQYKPKEEENVG